MNLGQSQLLIPFSIDAKWEPHKQDFQQFHRKFKKILLPLQKPMGEYSSLENALNSSSSLFLNPNEWVEEWLAKRWCTNPEFEIFKSQDISLLLSAVDDKKKPELEAALNAYLSICITISLDILLENCSQNENESEASNDKEKDEFFSKKVKFLMLGFAFGMCEFLAGACDIFELELFLAPVMHIPFCLPAAICVSLFFGIIAFAVAAVFDIKAIADAMGVSYLTPKRELKTLINQAEKLKQLNQNITTQLKSLDKKILQAESISAVEKLQNHYKELLQTQKEIVIRQEYVDQKIDSYTAALEKSAHKLRIVKLIWIALAAALCAASTNLTAFYFFTTFMPALGFPPLALGMIAIFATLWMTVQVAGFIALEGGEISSGFRAILGSPVKKIKKAKTLKEEVRKNSEDNAQELSLIEKKLLHQQDNINQKIKAVEQKALLKKQQEEIEKYSTKIAAAEEYLISVKSENEHLKNENQHLKDENQHLQKKNDRRRKIKFLTPYLSGHWLFFRPKKATKSGTSRLAVVCKP